MMELQYKQARKLRNTKYDRTYDAEGCDILDVFRRSDILSVPNQLGNLHKIMCVVHLSLSFQPDCESVCIFTFKFR